MTDIQQGDVNLFQTADGGEINVVGGVTEMNSGWGTFVYLCLFGGNSDDPGGADTTKSWWGNGTETDTNRMYRSETQYILKSLPAITSNLLKVKEAVLRDLKVIEDIDAASEITVGISIPTLNKIQIDISIFAFGEKNEFQYTENWEAAA